MDRELFLKNKWTRYPVFPEQALARGRVVSLQKTASGTTLIGVESQTSSGIFEVTTSETAQILITGDLVAIVAKELWLLAPALSPGLAKKCDEKTLRQWSQFLQLTRSFFSNQEFLEIHTPSLVTCPGTEPSLEVFSTELKLGSKKQKVFLPTSPEISLKKTLHLGFEKIFEIARCYRNDESTDRHLPEFWMLEWYRAYEPLSQIQKDLSDFIYYLSSNLPGSRKPSRIQIKTVRQLFLERFEFDFQPDTTSAELTLLAQKFQIDTHAASSIDDVFFLLFFEIEKNLNPEELVFVMAYPPYQAALAKVAADGWAERFEAYWRGFELANAFLELNDPEVQKQRAYMDLQKKASNGKAEISLDLEFFQALEAGMPPSAGVALGLERLFMALHSLSNIEQTRLF